MKYSFTAENWVRLFSAFQNSERLDCILCNSGSDDTESQEFTMKIN